MLTWIELDRSKLWRHLPPIFQAVADADSSRFDFSEPWLHRGCLYASDGKIVARVAARDLQIGPVLAGLVRPVDDEFRSRVASALPLLFDHAWSDAPTPLPFAGIPRVEDCPSCKGIGCDFCDGEGQLMPFDNRMHVAPGLDLCGRYVGLLRDHGVASVYRAADPSVPQVFFARDGVEGLLMPLAPEGTPCEAGAVGRMAAVANTKGVPS